MNQHPAPLTLDEVCRLCGFSETAMLRWVWSGELASQTTPDLQCMIAPGDLMDFLQRHCSRVLTELLAPMPHATLAAEPAAATLDSALPQHNATPGSPPDPEDTDDLPRA